MRWSEIHQSYLLRMSLNCCDGHADYLPKQQKSTLANSSHWCLERRVVHLEHPPTPSTLAAREGHLPGPSPPPAGDLRP